MKNYQQSKGVKKIHLVGSAMESQFEQHVDDLFTQKIHNLFLVKKVLPLVNANHLKLVIAELLDDTESQMINLNTLFETTKNARKSLQSTALKVMDMSADIDILKAAKNSDGFDVDVINNLIFHQCLEIAFLEQSISTSKIIGHEFTLLDEMHDVAREYKQVFNKLYAKQLSSGTKPRLLMSSAN